MDFKRESEIRNTLKETDTFGINRLVNLSTGKAIVDYDTDDIILNVLELEWISPKHNNLIVTELKSIMNDLKFQCVGLEKSVFLSEVKYHLYFVDKYKAIETL